MVWVFLFCCCFGGFGWVFFFAILRKCVLCLVGLLGVPLNTEGKALPGQQAGNFFS